MKRPKIASSLSNTLVGSALSLSAIGVLCVSTSTYANQISGTVIDEQGSPVVNGYVQIMGTNKRANIHADGFFIFEKLNDGIFELHVSSSQHIHSIDTVIISDQQPVVLNIQVDDASIEVFDVRASAFHASNIESSAPVSILAGEKLKQQQAATLGETLKNQVGVHSSFYGGVTSSPIIRGLDGPRVLITQNGMDAADASRMGPDHLVSTESSTVEQIEVLRGPATLFYGSGAIGGVVNLVDKRIPDSSDTEGEASFSRNSNNSQESFSGRYKTGVNNIAIQVHGFYRDSDNYRIPGYAESETAHEEHEDAGNAHEEEVHEGTFGVVTNTGARTKGLTLGTSYLFDEGHVGISMEHMSSLYGVPGHAHAEHSDGILGIEAAETIVKADLRQNRYQLAGEFQLSTPLISAVNFGVSYTDYQHTELENNVAGTEFSNELFETRLEILHQTIAGWRGGISLHTKLADFAAVGEEAYTPPSDTKSFGLGLIEERHFGDWLVQLGARIEKVKINIPSLIAPDIEFLYAVGEHEQHDEDMYSENLDQVSLSFTPISLSAGVVWDIAKGYNLAASYVHANRAPSSAELFAFGPHIGTQTYEIGSLYDVHTEQTQAHIIFNPHNVEMETSNNIDISWRKFGGDFGAVINVFYNQVDDYYYAANTGLEAAFGHAEEDEHMADESAEEGLPVFAYVTADAQLYGAEMQFTYRLNSALTLSAQGDYIRAKVKQFDAQGKTENLPRIPPIKAIVGADYKTQNMTFSAQVTRMFSQNKIANFESTSKAYTLLDINASYFTEIKDIETEFYFQGRNLNDEQARVHTSFLKDLAPLPGRAIELGVRLQF